MRTLRIEMNRGHGWELRAESKIPADTSIELIKRGLQDYAVQYPDRALLDSVEVARAGRGHARGSRGALGVRRARMGVHDHWNAQTLPEPMARNGGSSAATAGARSYVALGCVCVGAQPLIEADIFSGRSSSDSIIMSQSEAC
jgi:hypothetical protein